MLRILIADDEQSHRVGLLKHVRWNELGYETPLQAEDFEEALFVTRDNHIDVLIADVCMPGMDGIELVKEMRRRFPELYVLIISGYEEFEFARAAVEAGAKAYLLKPLKIEEVERWLGKFRDEIRIAEKLTGTDTMMKKKLISSLPKKVYDECVRLINNMQQHEKDRGIPCEKGKHIELEYPEALEKIHEEIMGAIGEMNGEKLEKLLPSAFDHFEAGEKFSFSLMQSFSLGVISELHRKSEATGFQMTRSYTDYCREILACAFSDELKDITYEILTGYFRSYEEYRNQRRSKVIETASQYISDHLKEDTTVKELSEIVHMNPSYLSVLFKKEMGVTISEYVAALRVKKAKELLYQGFKVVDIAREVGYKNPSFFANQFKTAVGLTPAEYRKYGNGV